MNTRDDYFNAVTALHLKANELYDSVSALAGLVRGGGTQELHDQMLTKVKKEAADFAKEAAGIKVFLNP